jgi:hypothetical protein
MAIPPQIIGDHRQPTDIHVTGTAQRLHDLRDKEQHPQAGRDDAEIVQGQQQHLRIEHCLPQAEGPHGILGLPLTCQLRSEPGRSCRQSRPGGARQSPEQRPIGAGDPFYQPPRAVGQPRDCAAVPGSAESAKWISVESECEAVFFMRRLATSSGVGADGPAGESAVASSRVRVRPGIFQQYPVFRRKWDQNFGAWPKRFPPLSAPRTSEYR